MNIYIPSLNRPKTIISHLMPQIQNMDWKIVVHTEEQRSEYLKNPTIPRHKILVSNQPYNLSLQTNWIRDNLVKKGEWFIRMNDNIENINIYPEPWYSAIRIKKPLKNNRAFQIHLEHHYPDNFEDVVAECRLKADDLNTGLVGFSAHQNYFFRGSKWRKIAMVTGKLFMCKNDELRADPSIYCMEDYEYSCQAMLKYGRILVNGFVFPNSKFNQPGGLGKLSERGNKKVEDCKIIMDRYPELFRYKNRVNSLENAEIVLRGHTESFFNNWRNKHDIFRTKVEICN